MCWNRWARITDYLFVDCDDFREALSARLDNEEGVGDSDHPTEAHLDHCADCAYWFEAAALITRRTRTTAAVAWPDVADAVLARVPPGIDRPWSRLRVALGAVGALQCGAGLVTLTTLTGNGYETGAWQLALGVALSVAAARRTAVTALVPLLGTLVAMLAWGQVADGLRPTGVVSLVLTACGLAIVVLLARMPPVRRGPAPPKLSANRLRRPRPSEEGSDGNTARLTMGMSRSAKTA